ncbi:tumor necrosis factor receptor superfamily member 6 [Nerophis lumbriciformis]|uniref:tumor necrosis factor receptor superfamily member 6 n=1 Tax=Nerophis lumbriciformis TaxID=546530 RepID=UPI002ADFB2E3|nr:tumor necrosis factor receptor superfamily member 6-like [Nerophis lumbriciformis]
MREYSHRSNMKMRLSSLFATFSIFIFHLSLARADAVRRNRRGAELKGESSPVLQDSQCADGVYQHGKTTCCLCAAGQRLKKDCTSASPLDRKCEVCEPNTFRSSPNQQKTCERCTSCSHPNAYLEVDTACTRASDTKCRCKARHYCTSLSDRGCNLCHPCRECGAEGVKVACAAAHDTVCNDILNARRHLGTGLAAAVFLLGVGLCWVGARKRLSKNRTPTDPNGNETEENDPNSDTTEENVLQLLLDKDPSPYLPEIAGVVGWKTMRHVAMTSGMSDVAIEACELNFPNDSEERTLQLLRKWVQGQGRDAMKNLVETLEKINHMVTKQKVVNILL